MRYFVKRIKCFHYAAISRRHKIFRKMIEHAIITSQNTSYTTQAHYRRRTCKNHGNLSTLQIIWYQIRTHWRRIVYCRCGDQWV